MHAIFVNHCHPEKPHVCAIRMKSFAYAMAVRGHKIILLTEALEANYQDTSPKKVKECLKNHNWSEPFVLPITPVLDSTLNKLRQGMLGFGFRQFTIFHKYLLEGGLFYDWRKGARDYYRFVEEGFNPDVIWASFGNTDCWSIAQELSQKMNCPWVADLKDNWEVFLPKGMVKLLARRFRGMQRMTAFSYSHGEQIKRIFGRESTVIYSGFPNEKFNTKGLDLSNRIMITGSLYDLFRIKILIGGILKWIEQGSMRTQDLEVRYVGADFELFKEFSAPLLGRCNLVSEGYIPTNKLRELQANTWVNAYIYHENSLFQHKTLELLSAGRPVISVPGESKEFVSIVKSVGAELQICSNPESVALALEGFSNYGKSKLNLEKIAEFSWESQVLKLENVLASVCVDK